MDKLKKYERYINTNADLVLSIRNAFTSKVTGSSLQVKDTKSIQKQLSVYKNKHRIKIMEKFMIIKVDVNRWEDVIPAVNQLMEFIENI